MAPSRLTAAEIHAHFAKFPAELRAIGYTLRETILRLAPQSAEALKFDCLAYFLVDTPYRSIGGNICMIEIRERFVRLSFIHGARLPDPHHLLCGNAKAKRFVPIKSCTMARGAKVRGLLRSSIAYAEKTANLRVKRNQASPGG